MVVNNPRKHEIWTWSSNPIALQSLHKFLPILTHFRTKLLTYFRKFLRSIHLESPFRGFLYLSFLFGKYFPVFFKGLGLDNFLHSHFPMNLKISILRILLNATNGGSINTFTKRIYLINRLYNNLEI